MRDEKDFKAFDIKDIFNDPKAVVLVEWAERVKKALPRNVIRVHIDHIDKNKRRITIT